MFTTTGRLRQPPSSLQLLDECRRSIKGVIDIIRERGEVASLDDESCHRLVSPVNDIEVDDPHALDQPLQTIDDFDNLVFAHCLILLADDRVRSTVLIARAMGGAGRQQRGGDPLPSGAIARNRRETLGVAMNCEWCGRPGRVILLHVAATDGGRPIVGEPTLCEVCSDLIGFLGPEPGQPKANTPDYAAYRVQRLERAQAKVWDQLSMNYLSRGSPPPSWAGTA